MQAAGLIVGPLLEAALLTTHLSHEVTWRILVAFAALRALAVYAARRKLKETPRFLKAAAQEELSDQPATPLEKPRTKRRTSTEVG
jgi:MFS family permease